MTDSPPDPEQEDSFYVSTPQGIFTASGVWFNAREEDLHEYAAPVLQYVSLERLLQRAVVWFRSPQIVTIWIVPLLLFATTPLAAATATIVFFIAWKALSPSFVSRWAARVLGWLDNAVLQALFYVFVLSYFAALGDFASVGVGLAAFIALRWRLVERGTQPFVQPIKNSLYELPLPDQILRAFIIRAAVEHRVDLPQVRDLTREIFDKWGR